MKWKEGFFVICPFCQSKLIGGGRRKDGAIRIYSYECGCRVAEFKKQSCVVERACVDAMKCLSTGLTHAAKKYDLWTIPSWECQEVIAEQTANYTEYALYLALRYSAKVFDNSRLPPIPCFPSHIKIAAEHIEKLKSNS